MDRNRIFETIRRRRAPVVTTRFIRVRDEYARGCVVVPLGARGTMPRSIWNGTRVMFWERVWRDGVCKGSVSNGGSEAYVRIKEKRPARFERGRRREIRSMRRRRTGPDDYKGRPVVHGRKTADSGGALNPGSVPENRISEPANRAHVASFSAALFCLSGSDSNKKIKKYPRENFFSPQKSCASS